jgi:putative transposase
MKKWIGTRRKVYNTALQGIKTKKDTKINFFTLRNKYVTAKNNPLVEDWQLKTPKDIRAGAIRDLVKNYTSAFALLKNRRIKGFKMNFASKKDVQSIEIPKSAIKIKNGIFIYNSYMPEKIKVGKREKLNFEIECDCRLKLENNNWFLCVPIKVKAVKEDDRVERKEFASIDPGTKSFHTVYSEDMVLQIKVNKEKLKLLQKKLDDFKSLRDKKVIKKNRFKRKERKTYFKINNLIDDLHFKTINYLTRTFKHIIIPTFDTQKMTSNNKNRTVNRDLLQLKHYLYKQRLQAKCLLQKCTIDVCTEEYTSQTCGNCGFHRKIGNADIYKCTKCDLVLDRDVNGARNIAIKRIMETSN